MGLDSLFTDYASPLNGNIMALEETKQDKLMLPQFSGIG